MSALPKIPSQQVVSLKLVENKKLLPPKRPILDPNEPIFINSATYLNDPNLLDDEFFSYYFAYCAEQSPRLAKYKIDGYKEEFAYPNKVKMLSDWGEIPKDYQRRLALRQIAQGIYYSPKLLKQLNIVFYEPPPEIPRLQREHRQPTGIADFVLIDHRQWRDYANMQRLYDKLPQHLPLAKDKKEPTNRYIDKSVIMNYPYYTPNRRGENGYIHKIVFDIDPINKDGDFYSDGFFKWADVGLPPPNLIIANPQKNGSYQLVYFLLVPLRPSAKYPCIRQMNWYNRIVKRMTALLGADMGFNGGRCKNPFSSEHDLYVSGAEPYTLQELSDKCDLVLWEQEQRAIARTAPQNQSATTIPKRGIYDYIDPIRASNEPKITFADKYWQKGNNGQAFEDIRHRVYKKAYLIPEDLEIYIRQEYDSYQKHLRKPMPDCDIRASVKSMLNYCIATFGAGSGKLDQAYEDRLQALGYAKSARAKQLATLRAINSNKLRWVGYDEKQIEALEMMKKGIKQAVICAKLNVNRRTLTRWKNANKIN